MQTAVIQSGSDNDFRKLLELAHKLGLKTKVLSENEQEEMGLAMAIKTGRTGEYIDTDLFLKRLKGQSPD